MATKLSSLTLPKRIGNWVFLRAYFSSISCAIDIQRISESDQNRPNSPEFEATIQFLKNKLNPENLVSALDHTPDFDSSIRLFKWASLQKRFHHTADTYSRIILKLGMAGKVEEVEGFCKQMVREKCVGLENSLLELIQSFVNNHRLSEALRVLYVMNTITSFKVHIGIFNSLMAALVQEKRDFKDVVFVYKEMVKAVVLPNIDTLNFLLEASFESGRVDTAIDQYQRLHKKGCKPNSRTFEIVISGLCDRDRVEESIIVLNEMSQVGCQPDLSFHSRIIPMFCRLGNLEIGMRLFKIMKASNISPIALTYTALISCLCEFLRVDDAIELYEEMKIIGLFPELQENLDLVYGFCKLNRFDEAKAFLKEKNLTDACVHNAILGSYCDIDNFGMAKDFFDEMFERDTINASSWNIVISYLCKNSLMDKALEYLHRMILSSFVPDSTTFSALVLGNCRTGKIDRSLDLFQHIQSKRWVLDYAAYAELVESLCHMGNTQCAIEVFHYMCTQDCALSSTSFGLLIDKLCADGEVEKALRLLPLSCYANSVSCCTTYNSILRGLFKLHKENDVLAILSRMIVIGCNFNQETYCILIKSMAVFDRVGDCIFFFNLMLSKDLLPDSLTLTSLLSCLANHSQMHLIISSIDDVIVKFELLDPVMYNIMINSLWREGYKGEARELLDLMLDKGWVPDSSTHALIMGSAARKEITSKSGNGNYGMCDNVSSILMEGLRET